jgi:hypothetical protein
LKNKDVHQTVRFTRSDWLLAQRVGRRTIIHDAALNRGRPINPKGGLVMTMMKLLIGGGALAAIAATVPAAAQTNVGMAWTGALLRFRTG